MMVLNNGVSDRSDASLFDKVVLKVRNFAELIRFSHTIFAMPFALLAGAWAMVMPSGSVNPAWSILRWGGVLCAMVTARSFAMAFNRLVDAKYDAKNPRTANRHLPSGSLKKREVTAFALVAAFGFIGSCLLFFPNWIPILLAIPVLLFIAGYSFAKRFTRWTHVWLGAALMLAPICTWLALRGEIVLAHPADLIAASMLGLSVLFWVAGFDIIYACQDVDADRQAKLFSLPATIGVQASLKVAAFCHATMVMLLAILPHTTLPLHLQWIWYGTLLIVAVLLLLEHRSVSSQDVTKINFAFFQLNAIISVLLLSAGTIDAIW